MQFRSAIRTASFTLSFSLACLMPLGAQAQAQDDGLKYELNVYGWFPGIGGTTSFPSGGTSVEVSAENVIDALKFAFMGSFGIKQGAWGVWTDLVYTDLGESKSGSRDFSIGHQGLPASLNADLSLDMTAWIWTLAGTYELAKSKEFSADILLGARLLDIQQTLDWTLQGNIGQVSGIGHKGSSNADASVWDGIVGIKGNAYLGDERKWFIPYYFDIGTGQSDLTWQVNVGIGYQFDWGALMATWRYLDYNFSSDKPIQTLDFSGPTLGANFKW